MLCSLWTRGCSVLLIGAFLLGNGLPWQRAADDPYAFVPEPENTVQIACVGNSDLYSGFVPPVLWGNQGYSATVYASARQSLTKSYALLERVFATQSPELVVLETDMLYDHNPQERETPRVLARQTRAKHLGQDMRNLASVFRQTGAQVTPGDFPSIRRTHGYRYSTKVTRLAMPDYMADTGEREQISAENRKAADRILQLCRENGAQLLLVELPTVTSWNAARHRGVVEFAAARELEFLDLNLLYDQMGLDGAVAFRDAGNHLNVIGATAVTAYLGRYIARQYRLPDLRGNSRYANRQEEWVCYRRFVNGNV